MDLMKSIYLFIISGSQNACSSYAFPYIWLSLRGVILSHRSLESHLPVHNLWTSCMLFLCISVRLAFLNGGDLKPWIHWKRFTGSWSLDLRRALNSRTPCKTFKVSARMIRWNIVNVTKFARFSPFALPTKSYSSKEPLQRPPCFAPSWFKSKGKNPSFKEPPVSLQKITRGFFARIGLTRRKRREIRRNRRNELRKRRGRSPKIRKGPRPRRSKVSDQIKIQKCSSWPWEGVDLSLVDDQCT